MSDSMAGAVASLGRSVGKSWKEAKRHTGRDDHISRTLWERQCRAGPPRVTIGEVAFEVMEEAYLKASGGGRYPANARQIYYTARPAILARADTRGHTVSSQYFCQVVLKDYLESRRPNWDVVFDARGHLREPHTDLEIGLGGLEVRKYVAEFGDGVIDEVPSWAPESRVAAVGPGLRYGGVLFIEKEGFGPLLEAAQIAKRFDVAIASTKGMPVSACCDLLGEMDLPVYVVRDFDKAGFSIVAALERGTRGSRNRAAQVIDLGLRLGDIEGLEREPVTYKQSENPASNLRRNGATRAEMDVLCHAAGDGGWGSTWEGERVELNAMTSDQFVHWLEVKLKKHRVQKIVPTAETVGAAYRRAVFLHKMGEQFEAFCEGYSGDGVEVPDGLLRQVKAALKRDRALSWDDAVWQIAAQGSEGEGGECQEGDM